MGNAILQPNLQGGELSNYLVGRVDLARYQNSVALARNWFVRIGGGLTNRAGFRFVWNTADSTVKSRLIPFQFSSTQSYALEFGEKTLQFYSGGAPVLQPSGTVTAGAVGTGNGSQTVFTPSPAPSTVSAVYRDDWQGNQALSTLPRTNYGLYSEDLTNSGWVKNTGVTVTAAATTGPRTGSSACSVAYSGSGTAGDIRITSPVAFTALSSIQLTLSIWLKATGTPSVVLNFCGNTLTCALTSSWQLFTLSGSIETDWHSPVNVNFSISSPAATNTSFTIYCDNYQIEYGTSATPYIGPVLASPVTVTDYSFDATTGAITFGEIPLSGATLTYDGYLSPGVPYQIVSPYAAADLPLLAYTQNADVMTLVHPSYAPHDLKRYGLNNWTLTPTSLNYGPFQDLNADPSITVNFSDTDGQVTITASNAIFTADKNGSLFYAQEDLSNPAWGTGQTISVGNLRRWASNNYIALTSGTTGNEPPVGTIGTWNDGGVNWAYRDSGFGIARVVAVASDGFSCTANVISHIPDNCVVSTTQKTITGLVVAYNYFNIFTVASHGYVVGQKITYSVSYKDSYGNIQQRNRSVRVTALIDSNNFRVDVGGLFPDFNSFVSGNVVAGSSVAKSSPPWLWAFGAWSDALGYPQAVTYHQQRLAFAGNATKPNGVWMSRSGAYGDFGTSIPIEDDDALTFGVYGTSINQMRSLLSLGQLLALSDAAEWIIGGNSQTPITPSTLSAQARGYYGASTLPILPAGKSALYVQNKSQSVREIIHDSSYGYDTYSGSDLSLLASHLFEGYQILEWTFQTVPNRAVWAVRDDGVLLCLTYDPEQQIAAWTRHDTVGTFESVCCISEGNEDAVYAIVNRTINGSTVRSVERMDSRLQSDPMGFCFMDCALSFDGRNTTSTTITVSGGTTWDNTDSVTLTASASTFVSGDVGDQILFVDADLTQYRLTITAYSSATVVTARPERLLPVAYQSVARTDWAFARLNFSGATNLAACSVSVLADGAVVANANLDATLFTVASDGTFSLTVPAYRVTVGLPIQADIQTLSVVAQGEVIQDKKKSIPIVRMLVDRCCPLFVGRSFTKLTEQKLRSTEGYDIPTGLLTGLGEIRISNNWSKDGSFCIRNNYPQPSTILSFIPELTVGDK